MAALDKAIYDPPPDVAASYLAGREEWSAEAQSAAFLAAMGQT